MYCRYIFQCGSSLNGLLMNTSSSFECGLSVVTQEKGQQGNREFPERDLPVGRPDPAQREVKQYKN